MINERKFVVALDADDALNTATVWVGHPDMRIPLDGTSMFTSADKAHARLDYLIQSAKNDGVCEPGHECGRCKDWPPQVWEVSISVTTAPKESSA